MLPLLLSTLALAADCPAGFPRIEEGWNRSLPAAGQKRDVYAIFPPGQAEPSPVFFAWNGTSEDGGSFARRAQLQDFADRGMIVLAPSSKGNGTIWPVWDALREKGHENDPNPDLILFDTRLACISAQRLVDADRIYAGGHSAGGIFTNHLLQRRSELLAGVIVASGIYSQTSPSPAVDLAPTTVLLTWGGANDRWSGRAGAAAVKDITFASEGSLAGAAYARMPGVQVITCVGEDLGHAWLDDANHWMIDHLYGRPRGAPMPAALGRPLPAGARAQCTLGPIAEAPPATLACPASATPGCTALCQQISDGAATNRTVGPVLRRELRQLGFSDGSCGGCVARCEAEATTPADAAGLACLADQPRVDPAMGGINGAMPLISAINACCGANDGPWCGTICGALHSNLVARSYVPACAD
jgi:predicted esterase